MKTHEALNTFEMTEALLKDPKMKAISYADICWMAVKNINGIITRVCPYTGKVLSPLQLGELSLQAKWTIEQEKPIFDHETLEKARFDWLDLHGKTLEIRVAKSIDGLIVIGVDKDDRIYVLQHEIKMEMRRRETKS